MSKRLAIIRAGALGDVVLTLPVLYALREQEPDVQISVVGYPAFWALAGDLADDVLSIDQALFSTLYGGTPSPELRAWLAGFDRVIAWTARPLNPALAPESIFQASPYPPPGVHAAAHLLRTLKLPDDRCFIDPALADWAQSFISDDRPPIPVACIHPGAGAVWKRWPAERFAAVVDGLTARGFRAQLIEGPADGDAASTTQRHATTALSVIRETSVLDLARRLAAATVYIGNDSGVTHLAAALGLPTIAIFGPTDPVSWGPLRKSCVLRACEARAAFQGQIRVCDDPGCLEGMPVEAVIEAVSVHANL